MNDNQIQHDRVEENTEISFKKNQGSLTLHHSPRRLPPQNPFPVELVFFVTSHHGKGHGLL